jgi:hypothetical protein
VIRHECDICGGDSTKATHRTGISFNIGEEELDSDLSPDSDERIDICDDCGKFMLASQVALDQIFKELRVSLLRTMSAYRSKVVKP